MWDDGADHTFRPMQREMILPALKQQCRDPKKLTARFSRSSQRNRHIRIALAAPDDSLLGGPD